MQLLTAGFEYFSDFLLQSLTVDLFEHSVAFFCIKLLLLNIHFTARL